MLTEHDRVEAEIKVDEGLWRSSILPEGVLERWLVQDGVDVAVGHAVAAVRIEDGLHELIAPASGRLQILTRANAVVGPNDLVARILATSAQS